MKKKIGLGLIFLAFYGFTAIQAAEDTLPVSISLEIFTNGPLPPAMAQDWGRALNKCGFQSTQLRTGDASDALDILEVGGGYRVLGKMTDTGNIILPGGESFSKGQIREMKPYLEKKIREIAQREAEKKAATPGSVPTDFGIDSERLKKVISVLAEPTGFSTKGKTRKKVLHGITKSLDSRTVIPKEILDELEGEDLVTEELQGVSKGTALSYVLRYIGYCFVLEKPRAKQIRQDFTLRIMPGQDAQKRIFPVGHAMTQNVPLLNEKFHANVNGAKVSDVLDAIGGRLKLSILYDYNSMAGLGIEPAKVLVRQKPIQISYDRLLDTILFQAGLQKEVRMDEAGNPFLWISTIQNAGE